MKTTRLSRWAPALLLLGAAALYLFRLGHAGLYDDDESVYAEISREMLALRHWLTPHLDAVPYLEKPPLFYWLNTFSFRFFGLSEFTARLATALAAVAGVGCVYALGCDFWGRRAGLAAGAVLATSFGYFVFGRLMLPDMLFSACLAASFWGFGRTLVDPDPPPSAVFAGYMGAAAAVMAKGLIGAIFPALTVAAFLLVTRDWRLWRRLELARGGALFLALVLPWHVAIALKYPGFFHYYVIEKHLYRFLGHPELLDTVSLPIPTYLAMTLAWFCPWAIFLPVALLRGWGKSGDPGRRGFLFVLLWAGGIIGFFACSASRLEYYALPALPALALCVGRLWGRQLDPAGARRPAPGMAATWIAVVAFVLCLVPAVWLFPRLEHVRFYNLFPRIAQPGKLGPGSPLAAAQVYDVPGFAPLVPLLEVVVALIAAGAIVGAWAWFQGRRSVAFVCLCGAMAVGLTTVEDGFRLYAPYRSVALLARLIRRDSRSEDQIVVEGKYEKHAGIAFYTGRRVRIYHGLSGILVNGSRYTGTDGTFVTDAEFDRLWRGAGRVFLLSAVPDCLARMRAIEPETVVLGRTGNNWLLANRPGGSGLVLSHLTEEGKLSSFTPWLPPIAPPPPSFSSSP